MQDDDKFDDFDDLEDFDDLDDMDLGDSNDVTSDSMPDDGFIDGDDGFSDEDFAGDAFTDDLEDDEFSDLVDEDGGDGIDPNMMASNKSGMLSKFSFNQIVIGAAMLVGGGIFVFQLMTSTPAPVQSNFQSQVRLSGASDNTVYSGTNSEEQSQKTAQQIEDNSTTGILNNSDSLDSLEIDFNDTPMPTPISAESQKNDEEVLLQKDLGNDFSEFEDEFTGSDVQSNVVIAPEFETPMLDVPIVVSNDARDNTENQDTPVLTESGSEITTALPLRPEVTIAEPEVEVVKPVIDAQPEISKVTSPIPSEPATVVQEVSVPDEEALAIIEKQMVEPLKEELAVKDKKISSLQNEINKLQDQIESLKTENAQKASKPAEAKTVESTPTKKAEPVEVPKKAVTAKKRPSSSSTNQWELRAAQPGKAWVAQKGRDELQPVIVGDILSGLGKVEAIVYRDNKWVVVGSQGQINQ